MIKALVSSLLLLISCASCASTSQKNSSTPASTSKATEALHFSEVLVGRVPPQPVPSQFALELKDLPLCLKADLAVPEGFSFRVVNNEIKNEQGKLVQVEALVECFKSKNLFGRLNGYWVWTPNFLVPSLVRKNWISVPVKSPAIFQAPGKAPKDS